jgi:PAS domain S-box-containing protein
MLRARIAAVVVLVFVFFGLLDFALHRMVVAPNFRRLEEEGLKRDLSRVADAFFYEQARLDQVSRCWASMKQTRELVGRQDRDGIRQVIGEALFRESRCDVAFVVDARSDALWQGVLARTNMAVQQPGAEVSAAILARFTTFSGQGDSTRGILVVNGEPLLVAARPVASAENGIAGAVIVGRVVSGGLIGEVRQRTGSSVKVSTLAHGQKAAGTDPFFRVVSSSEDSIEGAIVLNDVDGQPALAVSVALTREGAMQALRASRFAMFSVVCTGVALLLLVLGMLETVIFSRIQRLAGAIEGIGKTGDLSVRLPDGGRDEIGQLGKNLNRMLEELESTERRLRQSEERYRSLFEGASDGILLLRDQRVVECNAMAIKMFGPDKQQIVGHLFQRFLPPLQPDGRDSRREWVAVTDGVRRGGATFLEWRFRRLDGTMMDAEVILSRVHSGAEEFLQVIVRDLTARREADAERRHLQEQLTRSQKLESLVMLADGITRDFSDVLVSISGSAENGLRELPPESPCRRHLEDVRKASARASEMANQMLAFSGRTRLSTQVVDVNTLIGEITQLMQLSVSKKVAMNLQLAEKVPLVDVDVQQMKQSILNLVANASEAIGDRPGTISLRTGVVNADSAYLSQTYINEGLREGQYVVVEVTDTGCGMDADTKVRLFDPFYTTKFAGRGLGLATVLGVVRAHHGAIHVYSELGKGTTMKLLLPVAAAGEDKAEAQPTSLVGWRGSGTVLVADDEEAMRRICKLMLEKCGFTVITADDGRDAVEKFSRYSADVSAVLLDLTMPRLSGEETYEELVKIRPDVKVILTSGYSETEACRRFGRRAIAGFVQKPFEYQVLMRKLRAVTSSRR